MPDLIKILPESLINKIAAGEVVQRPSSVVKELVENSIDAQADDITINIQEAGKSLIQVIDNGVGMSATDARLAFERHATSKISSTEDLFHIQTKGFRGEALASIASVAQVELRTRRKQDQIGTRIVIEGGKFILQEPVSCPEGANFLVKNLFFNVPARRKFLKSEQTEFKHILTEFYRLAIPHPDIKFSLYHNKQVIYKLEKSNSLKERIVNLFEKTYNKYLIPIDTNAGFVRIYGYIGTPESARKKYAEQYFFVNNRYFRSSYLHRAVMKAYEKVLSPELKPIYFIFFEIDPSRIDVNIHPTKVEVNFQDADSIYQLLIAGIKKALAQYGVIPMLDFETENLLAKHSDNSDLDAIPFMEEDILGNYNPFDYQDEEDLEPSDSPEKTFTGSKKEKVPSNWQDLFIESQKEEELPVEENDNTISTTTSASSFISFKGKYIITPLKSGLAIINIRRAYETIFFEQFLQQLSDNQLHSQQTLYPIKITFTHRQLHSFFALKEQFEAIGYVFERISENSFNIVGIPSFMELQEAHEILMNILNDPDAENINIYETTLENLAALMARTKAGLQKSNLSPSEMESLVNKLFASTSPNYSPGGKKNFHILKIEEIDKFFN